MNEALLTTFSYFLIAVNVIAFALMGIDKFLAKQHLRRVPEKVLFSFAIVFGGVGGTLGMYSFRHKTKHWYFAVFFPVLAILQVALSVWLFASAA